MNDNSYKVIEADINEILPNRFQPRIQFDEDEILELSDSIKEHGVIQPIVVRTIGDKYEIIAGERRYKASVLAGKETVPIIIKNLNDKDSAEIALIENIQRKNLTPIEEALSYKKILDMGYLTQETLANKLGKSQPSIANKIRLLNLSDEVQEALLDNKISERHARSLLRLKSLSDQNKMLNRITQERLTVRKTDDEIDKILKSSSTEEDDGTEKIKEKGDVNMNNEMNQIANVATQQSNNFDIFGNTPVQQVPSMPTMEPAVQNTETAGVPFDVNGMEVAQPVVPSMPEIPSMPTMEPAVQNTETAGVSFDVNGMGVVQPVVPSIPEIPSMPTMEPAVQNTETAGVPFDVNGIEVVQPVVPSIPEIPSVPTMEVPTIPTISPIIESNSLTTESLNNSVLENTNNNNEFIKPEPIIITDYNKQYDPVMPNSIEQPVSKVDFKEIINAIRECSNKIEQYGYKIDVEEYDLSTIYQVVFKVEK